METIIIDQSKKLELPFQWRDQKGIFHSIDRMETRHIFFVLRMIWNHSAPNNMKIFPYKQYRFGDFYSKEYIKKAIKAMLPELASRSDLTSYYKNCLSHIHGCLERRQLEGLEQ